MNIFSDSLKYKILKEKEKVSQGLFIDRITILLLVCNVFMYKYEYCQTYKIDYFKDEFHA